ncbi:hypothetical protein LPW11_22090 [Geomonas sp. RF6]|uniref:hypothetical protein n=1 Tax=Geomonas sp. RF6 TaxID=2897342 RepID=UPI001E2B984B|nr:hypothetical protein [Geomonas sp. RF6]UFS70546.1 hypothetical protein LPW11_22090 [Geomonas sp. RF6]
MPSAQSSCPLESTTPLMHGEAHSRLERVRLRPNSYSLTLRGYLTTGWAGRLASGLAQHGISIVRGEAERDSSHVWHSSLEITCTSPGEQPFGIDYVALAQKELRAHHKGKGIELKDFRLEPPARHGGSIYLEIKAEDRIGFLGDLFDYLSFKCLFPVRMTIETLGTTVSDRLLLRGVAGSIPSDSVYHGLTRDLEALTRR